VAEPDEGRGSVGGEEKKKVAWPIREQTTKEKSLGWGKRTLLTSGEGGIKSSVQSVLGVMGGEDFIH